MADFPHEAYGVCKTSGGKALLALLWTYASHEESSPFVFPSNETLSAIMDQDARSTRRQLSELKNVGLISEKRRRLAHGFVRGFVLTRPDAHVRKTDAHVREPDAAVHKADAHVQNPDAAVHTENEKKGRTYTSGLRTQLSGVRTHTSDLRTQLSGTDMTQEDVQVLVGGRSCPPKRTHTSGQADAHVLIIPNEAPMKPQLKPASKETDPVVRTEPGAGAGSQAPSDFLDQTLANAKRKANAADQAAEAAAKAERLQTLLTRIKAGEFDDVTGLELGVGAGKHIGGALWRLMCERFGKPRSPFGSSAQTAWAKIMSDDVVGEPPKPSRVYVAIENRARIEGERIRNGGEPTRSLVFLWAKILEETERWAAPDGGGAKSRAAAERAERHERIRKRNALRDAHKAELEAIDDEAERAHREQVLFHEAGLGAPPMSIEILRQSVEFERSLP